MIDSAEKDNQDALFALLRETKADQPDAWPSIISLLYHDLKKIAHRLSVGKPADRTLNTTSLVNECYLKIHSHLDRISDPGHLLALSARIMRQVMCDYSRHRLSQKCMADRADVDLSLLENDIASEAGDLVEIDDLLRKMEAANERAARVFECKYFSGMDDKQTATALDLSLRTVQREWLFARTWLRDQIAGDAGADQTPAPQDTH